MNSALIFLKWEFLEICNKWFKRDQKFNKRGISFRMDQKTDDSKDLVSFG